MLHTRRQSETFLHDVNWGGFSFGRFDVLIIAMKDESLISSKYFSFSLSLYKLSTSLRSRCALKGCVYSCLSACLQISNPGRRLRKSRDVEDERKFAETFHRWDCLILLCVYRQYSWHLPSDFVGFKDIYAKHNNQNFLDFQRQWREGNINPTSAALRRLNPCNLPRTWLERLCPKFNYHSNQ